MSKRQNISMQVDSAFKDKLYNDVVTNTLFAGLNVTSLFVALVQWILKVEYNARVNGDEEDLQLINEIKDMATEYAHSKRMRSGIQPRPITETE